MLTNRKRLSLILGALFIAGAGVATMQYHHGVANAQAANAPAATEVDVAAVVSQQVTEWQNYSGRLEAIDKVEIRPLASGKIVTVHFKDGAKVKKGDLLFTIDPQPYAAELDRAQAQVAAAEARVGYASSDLTRNQRLLADNAVSRRDFEEKRNASLEANAALRAAKAAVEAARINLAYTKITAPVSGRVSRAEMTVGNIVSAGANAPLLTTVVSQSPIYASFDVDEQTYLRYLRQGDRGRRPLLSDWRTRRATRAKAASTPSTISSIPTPARSACARALTMMTAHCCPDCMHASKSAPASRNSLYSSMTRRLAPTRPNASCWWWTRPITSSTAKSIPATCTKACASLPPACKRENA